MITGLMAERRDNQQGLFMISKVWVVISLETTIWLSTDAGLMLSWEKASSTTNITMVVKLLSILQTFLIICRCFVSVNTLKCVVFCLMSMLPDN
ncbi:transmembrane protein, putative [Medicago truncatula]|uniref:Transmembrane protein, putative n=1 Tax=Medicago truncatula TaxID=3880 RepID=A0A072UJE9_MEDTR|nr:transmembrane protein, putative [Medicago truncatula]